MLPIKEQAARLFYGKLFEMDPSLRRLFKGNMGEQERKLMSMLNTAVNGLSRLETLVPAVQDLGRRHANYGVTDEHYIVVGAALSWTLQQGLGAAFTPEAKQAWTATYEALADTMKRAAAAPVSA
ncbi:MAG TPA: globin family protein [Steroidobacteraceae bacterium]|nr:globin family protein [Steroidobacteraceae bacterium]